MYNLNIDIIIKDKKRLLIIAVTIIAVLIWYIFYYLKISVKIPGIKSQYQSAENFSKYLPKEILIDSKSQLLQNFTRVEPEGTFYSLIEFSTDKSLDDYFEMYKKELLSNNWKILSSIDGKYAKNIEAMKEKKKLVFQINYYEETNKNIITIHYFDYSNLVFPSPVIKPLIKSINKK